LLYRWAISASWFYGIPRI